MSIAPEAPAWIGPRPSAPQIAALISCGVAGLMIAGLQPLLLGGLAEAGRVSGNQLGQVATAELLCMGLTAGIAGSVLEAKRLKLLALLAFAALAAADFFTPAVSANALLPLRAAAGVPSGILVWITISLIARTPTPERWAGAFVTAQTLAQLVLSLILAAFVMGSFGVDGGFRALAASCALNAIAVFFLPNELAPLPRAATSGLPNARGWIALAVSFFFLGATSGTWVYVERIVDQAGHPPALASQAISLSLAFQVAGGVTATFLAGRIHWFRALIVCAIVDLCIFLTFATMPSATLFLALTSALGFIWLFATPFLVPLTIEADPTRRAALLIGGAQLVGGSLAPLFASLCVTETDVRGALAFSATFVMLAGAIALALHFTHRKNGA